MRAKGPLRVLVLLLAFSLLPATAVLATHNPTGEQVVAEAKALGMRCAQNAGEEDCYGSDPTSQGQRFAAITPDIGTLVGVTTHVTAAPILVAPGWYMTSTDQSFNVDLHSVGCADANAVGKFVASVAALSAAGTIKAQTVGECSVYGELFVNTDLHYYRITARVLPSAFSTPTPTPTQKPTPTPTAKPTATPTTRPTATVKPTATAHATTTATPTGSATASESLTSGESATASATATETANGTPEQSVAGIVFTPEPSSAPPAPAGGGGGDWAGSVPSANEVSVDPVKLAGSGLAALLLLLAMGFIGELFNNTFEANYDRLLAGWQKSWLGKVGKAFSGLWGGGK